MKLGLNVDARAERYDLIIKSLIGNDSIKNVAARLKITADQISRWIHRKSVPSLAVMLELVALKSDQLIPFLNQIINVSDLPELQKHYSRDAAICILKAQYPELTLVLYVFHLSSYKSLAEHSDQWVAKVLGISEEKVAMICKEGSQLGILKKEKGL